MDKCLKKKALSDAWTVETVCQVKNNRLMADISSSCLSQVEVEQMQTLPNFLQFSCMKKTPDNTHFKIISN